MDHPDGGGAGGPLRQSLHAVDNFGGLTSGYGGNLGKDQVEGALRLMLNDSLADKKVALVTYLQMGIDYYGNILSGQTYTLGGGHHPGMLLPIAFFGALLGDTTAQNNIKAISRISEKYTLYSTIYADGMGVWGFDVTEAQYWSHTCDVTSPIYHLER